MKHFNFNAVRYSLGSALHIFSSINVLNRFQLLHIRSVLSFVDACLNGGSFPFVNHFFQMFDALDEIVHRRSVTEPNMLNAIALAHVTARAAGIDVKENARNANDLVLNAFFQKHQAII